MNSTKRAFTRTVAAISAIAALMSLTACGMFDDTVYEGSDGLADARRAAVKAVCNGSTAQVRDLHDPDESTTVFTEEQLVEGLNCEGKTVRIIGVPWPEDSGNTGFRGFRWER